MVRESHAFEWGVVRGPSLFLIQYKFRDNNAESSAPSRLEMRRMRNKSVVCPHLVRSGVRQINVYTL